MEGEGGGGLLTFLLWKERGVLLERGGLIEDLRYINKPWNLEKKLYLIH